MQAIDQGAMEGAMDATSDGSGNNWRSDGWCIQPTSEQLKQWRIMQAIDHRAIEGAMDHGASDRSGTMGGAKDAIRDESMEGAMDDANNRWGNNWRSDGSWCKR